MRGCALSDVATAQVTEPSIAERPRAGRLLRHEWTVATIGSILLAVLMIWLRPPYTSALLTTTSGT